ncbi:MAG: isochorismatase [Gemmatimonadetes bacterium]|nr:isochorismatase [Gemmatimonadota bacterium]
MNFRPPGEIPPHFNAASVEMFWRVPYGERAAEARAWAETHRIRPSADDDFRTALLLVDCQNTFCLPGFELFVGGRSGRGAVDDNIRLCSFIYRNLQSITEIISTMDTHTALQIFHPMFWVDGEGGHPTGGETVIAPKDVEQGNWRVNPAVEALYSTRVDLSAYALHYVRRLTREGKYPLMIWPYHAMLGGIGHALVSAVEEAVFFHSIVRVRQTRFEIKGNHALTENYSVLRPEVMEDPDGQAVGVKNTSLVDHLLTFDAVIVAGQAKSHCVAWTVDDLRTEIQARDPSLAGRILLLEDCTSPVVVPDVIDFTDEAEEAFRRFAQAGMRLVRSAEPMERWGIRG